MLCTRVCKHFWLFNDYDNCTLLISTNLESTKAGWGYSVRRVSSQAVSSWWQLPCCRDFGVVFLSAAGFVFVFFVFFSANAHGPCCTSEAAYYYGGT